MAIIKQGMLRGFLWLVAAVSGMSSAWASDAYRPPGTLENDSLTVIASIRPLALLVKDVAGDAAEVDVLLPAGASPHHYSLRISDMQKLRKADLLVWLGPEFERFLSEVAVARPPESSLVLAAVPGLHWAATPGHQHEDTPGGRDMHLWLNPDNGRLLMRAIAQRLGELRPARARQFAGNLARAEAELGAAVSQVQARLAPLSGRGFGVSHDGFKHFVARFDLKQLAAVSAMPDQGLGARHLMQTVEQLDGAYCLMVEAGEAKASTARLQRLFKIPLVQADPLALDPNVGSYAALIESVGGSFVRCLEGKVKSEK